MAKLDPRFWIWARWKLGHGEFTHCGPAKPRCRPTARLPYGGPGQSRVPTQWYDEFERRYVRPKPPAPPPLPPPPSPPPSFFASRGLFTAQDPRFAAPAVPGAWIAVRPENQAMAPAGATIVLWEAQAGGLEPAAINRAAGYIAQAEGPGQLEAAINLGPRITVPKALVTNLFMSAWPDGWDCLPEAYANVNVNATPERMEFTARQCGAKNVYPVLGLYDGIAENGRRKYLSEYLREMDGRFPYWSAYYAEGMTPEDWQAW